ncbi:FAD/NAD(P)-binding domain-containing protein [Coniochaeta sp. PMI_546]|nr:FAD/NAD(P)-binding domain-containing protein [Coniochaeta sp. PMI_546]
MSKTVVILGGGISGIATAHKLLKHTAPKLKGLKVILVSVSTHFYFNIAAVRGLIPGEIPDDALFHPIEPGFDKYPKGSFEFVVGTATALDLAGNAVQVRTPEQDRTLVYDQLVIATGSSLSSDIPFKTLGSYGETIESWHKLQNQVKAAKSIVVAGAGPTGIETIGELANKYGTTKKLTLIIDGEHALPTLLPSVGKTAEAELAKMKVDLVRKVRVTGVEDIGDGTKLTLSNGKTLVTDVFLPLYGVRPNTSFVPAHLLDASGSVKVDKTLRVEGLKNVWAVGDVNNVEVKLAMRAESQTVHLFPNLEATLLGKGEATLAEYKPSAQTMMFVTVGKKKGTGQIGTWKAFSFMVSYVKGRTLFVDKVPPLVAGKSMLRAAI